VVSTAERYRTAAGAAAQLRYESGRLEAMGGAAQFAVPGVPGAVGIMIRDHGVAAGDVLFTAGSSYDVVAAATDGSGRGLPGPASLTRAARVQYQRVAG